MSTFLKERETVALGLGKISIGPSVANLATITQALTSTDYFSALTEVSFVINKQFKKQITVKDSVELLQDVFVSGSTLGISVTFIEILQKTLSYALGGDGGATELGSLLLTDPEDLRVELEYLYPNKTDKMIVILPRAVVTSSLPFSFEEEDNADVPVTFLAKRADLEVGGSAWATYPYGRIYFL